MGPVRLLALAAALTWARAGRSVPVRKWRVLGPFVIGKNELDGEPWHLSNTSELLQGGEVKWRKLTAESSGDLNVDWPSVSWQSLVNGVGGRELLEWQALAVASFKVSDAGTALITCRGISAFHVDDLPAPFVGDQYRAGLPGHPLHLDVGVHRITVRLRAKLRAQLTCSVEIISARRLLLFGGGAVQVPDVVDGVLASDVLAIPVVNQHPTEWLEEVTPVMAKSGIGISVAAEQPPRHKLAPGQFLRLAVRVALDRPTCPSARASFLLDARGAASGRVRSAEFQLPQLRCRQRSQSFLFTFLDIDGSIQQAAAVAPAKACGAGGCPVLLTLSGTSISASDSADAFKMMAKGDTEYRFGVNGAWLLAPNRGGAHNWEGPGHDTALSALRALPAVAERLGLPGADIAKLVISGHSMGGHGAWLLALAATDATLGLASSASWLRKDQYADSNKVFLHDLAASDVEPALVALLHSAESEYDAQANAATLSSGLRILLRVGADDATVHPWFSRRMWRTLLAAGASASEVSLTEVPGKEHWWWDTLEPNDGGAVNDAQMRSFFKSCLARPGTAKSLPLRWRLVVFNPAFSGPKGGFRVLQQVVPHRRSEVAVSLVPDESVVHQGLSVRLRVETANVRKLELKVTVLDDFLSSHKDVVTCDDLCSRRFVLDGQELDFSSTEPRTMATWCLEDRIWVSCSLPMEMPRVERTLATYGPMRRLFTAPVCGIFAGLTDRGTLEIARFIANLLFMTGNGGMVLLEASSVLDTEGRLSIPDTCGNLFVFGGPTDNAVAAGILQQRTGYTPPLVVQADGEVATVAVGGCQWSGDGVAALALLPWWRQGDQEQSLALIATGASPRVTAEAVALLAIPTIPPMTRQPFTHLLPDYVVLDVADTRARGAGGFLAAGFWSYRWQYEPRAAWEKSCPKSSVARAPGFERAQDEL